METTSVPARQGWLGRVAGRIGRILTATDGRDILDNSPDGWEVEQPWLWWDGPADGDGTGGPFGNPPPGADQPWRGRTLPAIGKCRELVCDALAGAPWHVFRDGTEKLTTPDWILDPQGLREDGRVHARVLDVRMSAVEFWSGFILSMIELGEGIAYVPRRDANGQPVGPLFLLNPRDVHMDGGRYFVGEDEELAPEEMIIVRNRMWPGRFRGMGIWDQYAESIGLAGRVGEFTDRLLGRGIPAGYLKVNSPDPSQSSINRLKEKWEAAHSGPRRRIAVLNAVTDFKPLEIDPQVLQLTELMKLTAWDVAMMYGVPPAKLGISLGGGSQLTYANIESQQIDYVQDALLPKARRIEATLDAEFPRGTEMKINLDGLRRGDTKSRYEAHKIGIEAGFLTVSDVRKLEDLPPREDEPEAPPADSQLALVNEPVQEQNEEGAGS